MDSRNEKLYELTLGQRVVMSLYHGLDSCANLQCAFLVSGELDKDRLRQSVQKVIDDNDGLRFRFFREANTGEIYQYMDEELLYQLEERMARCDTAI
jgi:hypothetical protein